MNRSPNGPSTLVLYCTIPCMTALILSTAGKFALQIHSRLSDLTFGTIGLILLYSSESDDFGKAPPNKSSRKRRCKSHIVQTNRTKFRWTTIAHNMVSESTKACQALHSVPLGLPCSPALRASTLTSMYRIESEILAPDTARLPNKTTMSGDPGPCGLVANQSTLIRRNDHFKIQSGLARRQSLPL